MSGKQNNYKLKALFWALVLGFGYVGLSSPDKVVITEHGQINGLLNEIREMVQGNSFWKAQLRSVRKELNWEFGEPARNAKLHREMSQFAAETDRDMQSFYREFPEMKPSRAEMQAEALRDRADAIESAELEREFEAMRQQRISELQRIENYLTARIN